MDRSSLHGGPPRGPGSAPPRGPAFMPPRAPINPRGPTTGSQSPARNSHGYKSLDALSSNQGPLDYGYGSQDARGGGNFAVHPAAVSVKINLKKAAVKIVRPANPPVRVSQAVAAPVNAVVPVHAKPQAEDRPEAHQLPGRAIRFSPSETSASLDSLKARLDQKAAMPKPDPPKTEVKLKEEAESVLDKMFARLTSGGSPSPSPKPVDHGLSSTRTATLGGAVPAAVETNIEVKVEPTIQITSIEKEPMDEIMIKPEQIEQVKTPSINDYSHWKDMSKEDLQREYQNKGSEYLASIPTSDSTTSAHLVKAVILKLRNSFPISTTVTVESPEELQSKYIGAIVTYVNGLPKNSAKSIDAGLVEKNLYDNDGNFLQLCAMLVDMQLIALENLEEVVGICQAIFAAVPALAVRKVATKLLGGAKAQSQSQSSKDDAPKEDGKVKQLVPTRMVVPGGSSNGQNSTIKPESLVKPVSMDPVDMIATWPKQEKRKNPAGCRTILLSGISWAKTIHELQGCVWGGRLESIALPQSGSSVATVKFLTVQGCQKFFDATANGIQAPGSRALITVEKHQGPNSVNDVMKNCSEGDASRCVRVVDADDDWGDTALRRIAIGTSKNKREIDIIKRGKTAQGRFYIEFRFTSILDAMNFMRALRNDEEWEHCHINYAKDPCETAQGVHFKDEDESLAGFV